MNPKELREQAIKDAKCGLILNAARQVFGEKGIWNTRMEDIAAVAGFSKPTLYNYFPDKESIIFTWVLREFQKLGEKTTLAVVSDSSFIEAVDKVFRIILSHFAENFSLIMDVHEFRHLATLNIDAEKHSELLNQFKKIMHGVLSIYTSLIEKGIARGEITSAVPVKTLAYMLSYMPQAIQMEWKLNGQAGDVDNAVCHLIDMVKQGFGIK